MNMNTKKEIEWLEDMKREDSVIALPKECELNKIYKDAWWKLNQAISDEIEKEKPEECPEYYWQLMSKIFHETFSKAVKKKEA